MKLVIYPARAAALTLLLWTVGAAGCSRPAPDEPVVLETVDVAPPIDAELSTEGDLQAVQRAAQLSGLVPGDMPPDLPLFVPASVVDFGGPSGGRAWVEFDAGQSPDAVRRWLGERLPVPAGRSAPWARIWCRRTRGSGAPTTG